MSVYRYTIEYDGENDEQVPCGSDRPRDAQPRPEYQTPSIVRESMADRGGDRTRHTDINVCELW